MNPTIKHAAERTLISVGATRLGRRRRRGQSLILAYHNVVPTGTAPAGDLNLHLPQREFGRQLDLLQRHHEVVPLAAMLQSSEPRQRPRVAITFDDAYAGALGAGVSELVRRGMPATIFVAPGLLGGTTWWDVLADPVDGLSPQLRARALTELAGKGDAVIRAARPNGGPLPTSRESCRIGSTSELEHAAAQAGITLASHTWSHPNLCALSRDELEHELWTPLQWLRARYNAVMPWLSYPYGLWSPDVANAATNAGYTAALRVEGGWFAATSGSSRYDLPRLNVPAGLSLNGFALRLAGIGSQR
jgi:peptidoglycan/xylan/chitin deacetylase (PgdA/CDA1 family)